MDSIYSPKTVDQYICDFTFAVHSGTAITITDIVCVKIDKPAIFKEDAFRIAVEQIPVNDIPRLVKTPAGYSFTINFREKIGTVLWRPKG